MTKTVSTGTPQPGDTVTWTIQVQDWGTLPLFTRVYDTLAPGTTFLDATLGGIFDGTAVNWTSLDTLAPLSLTTLQFRVIVGAIAFGTVVPNHAFGHSALNDTFTNVASFTVTRRGRDCI